MEQKSAAGTADPLTSPLRGKRILVVEDDWLVAAELCDSLKDVGATVLGPAPAPFYALGLLGRRGVDAAVLDIRLHGALVFDVADVLAARNIPIVFATASGPADLPAAYRGHPLLQKPVVPERLHAALARVVTGSKAASVAAETGTKRPDDQLVRVMLRALRQPCSNPG